VAPTVALPADGDPTNASTFAQAFKVLADFVAYFHTPTALASDWDGVIQQWKSARGHERFQVDHMGFPMGRVAEFDENWMIQDQTINTAAASVDLSDAWQVFTSDNGVIVDIDTPHAGAPMRHAQLDPSPVGAGVAVLRSRQLTQFGTDICFAIEFTAGLDTATAADETNYLLGVCNANANHTPAQIITGSEDVQGIWLYIPQTSDNIQLLIRGTGGAGGITLVDTGVAKDDSWHHWRLQWNGSSHDDASTTRVLLFRDGVLVGTSTAATMPGFLINAGIYFGAARVGASNIGSGINIYAPVKFRATMWSVT
jgi:hypothetical protein